MTKLVSIARFLGYATDELNNCVKGFQHKKPPNHHFGIILDQYKE